MYLSKHCTIYLNEINNWEAETTTNMLKIHRLIYRHDWLIIKMIKIRIPLLKKKKKKNEELLFTVKLIFSSLGNYMSLIYKYSLYKKISINMH